MLSATARWEGIPEFDPHRIVQLPGREHSDDLFKVWDRIAEDLDSYSGTRSGSNRLNGNRAGSATKD